MNQHRFERSSTTFALFRWRILSSSRSLRNVSAKFRIIVQSALQRVSVRAPNLLTTNIESNQCHRRFSKINADYVWLKSKAFHTTFECTSNTIELFKTFRLLLRFTWSQRESCLNLNEHRNRRCRCTVDLFRCHTSMKKFLLSSLKDLLSRFVSSETPRQDHSIFIRVHSKRWRRLDEAEWNQLFSSQKWFNLSQDLQSDQRPFRLHHQETLAVQQSLFRKIILFSKRVVSLTSDQSRRKFYFLDVEYKNDIHHRFLKPQRSTDQDLCSH